MIIYDISADILKAPVYPGDPEPRLDRVETLGRGSDCNLSALYCCLHNGTHADAPLHFIENGETVDRMPVETFLGECRVVEVPAGPITARIADELLPADAKRVIIKGNGEAYFSEDGALRAAERGYLLIGTDSSSVGIHGIQTPVHRALLGAGIALLEGLVLDGVPEGEYFLSALPVKIGGAEAAPVRAVLCKF